MKNIFSCDEQLKRNKIKSYKEFFNKDEFECPKCCNMTKSLNVENKAAYPKEGTVDTTNNSIINILKLSLKPNK